MEEIKNAIDCIYCDNVRSSGYEPYNKNGEAGHIDEDDLNPGVYPERLKKKAVPGYRKTKSKRYEVIGIITRILDLAGYELVDRIKLRDKKTGDILD